MPSFKVNSFKVGCLEVNSKHFIVAEISNKNLKSQIAKQLHVDLRIKIAIFLKTEPPFWRAKCSTKYHKINFGPQTPLLLQPWTLCHSLKKCRSVYNLSEVVKEGDRELFRKVHNLVTRDLENLYEYELF